jgi:ATP-dependent helicase HrpB
VKRSGLPIDAALPALRQALVEHHAAVLQAPPGAGKSTVVPLALLEEPWAAGKRIVLLEPRRLAARAVAQRMANTLGEPIGATVGYRMRLDTRVSRATRIEVVTEGVLTRMLQSDPALEGTTALIFDEFHERSLQADLGLALALDAQAHLTPELRLLVMSATVDAPAIAQFLREAPLVALAGRSFPVESHFLGKGPPILPGHGASGGAAETVERLVARLVRRALAEHSGDVLVFLPGAAEIRRVQSLLADAAEHDVRVMPLLGELSAAEQDAALAPSASGVRKVVLATNIAETSLTIEGIRSVVDAGLVRRSEFDPVTGMSRLVTRRISRASAEQRQGRAGRLGPGVCYRAWSEGAHRSLAPFAPPEILEADLMPLALELAAWGVREATELRWLEAPPSASLAAARELLGRLGALGPDGALSAHGRAMAALGIHPRLAHMLLKSREMEGGLEMAARLAALLSERDLLRTTGAARDVDIRSRLGLLSGESAARVERGALQRISRAARGYVAQLQAGVAPRSAADSGEASRQEIDLSGILLAFAYPDRIAQRRPGSEPRYLLANGRGAHFAEAHSLGREEFIVAVDLDDSAREARILLAAPLERAALLAHGAERLRRSESIEWSEREQAVVARQVTRLDELVVEEKPLPEVPPEATAAALLEGVRRLGISALPWSRESRELQARMEFVRAQVASPADAPAWPVVSDESLQQSLESWLLAWLSGLTRREHLARVPLMDALRALLSYEQLRRLDELAPTHLTVPSGSRVRIDYLDESAPVVAVRLQEVFGLHATPRIAGDRVPVTFKLLSPAQRPVQITRDLASFWRSTYAEVRKDLRGRYPRHYWPEDPLSALPTRRARPPS